MGPSEKFFDQHLAQTTPFPMGLEIDRAEGMYLWDTAGKRYTDMISGVGVSALGHGNAAIRHAIKSQVDRHMHVMVYGEFVQRSQQEAAAKLTALLPHALDTVYFVNSGAEAIDAALKLARRVTGRTEIIAMEGAYHGSTYGALSVSGNEMKKYAFRPLVPGVRHIPFNALDALQAITTDTAAVLAETVQGDAGIRIPDTAWMHALRMRCSETGTLLILDEIQCGLGRTGRNFAFEHYGIEPDILVLGKALGAGLPVGALVASKAHLEHFTHDPVLGHITTFGGHPVVCAAVAAGLDEMERLDVVQSVESKGKLIESLLSAHPAVKDFRRKGLYMAIELESAENVQSVVEACLERGIIGFWFLSCPEAFRLAPPLVITEKELRESCQRILEALDLLTP